MIWQLWFMPTGKRICNLYLSSELKKRRTSIQKMSILWESSSMKVKLFCKQWSCASSKHNVLEHSFHKASDSLPNSEIWSLSLNKWIRSAYTDTPLPPVHYTSECCSPHSPTQHTKNLHSLQSVSRFPEAPFGWWNRTIGFGQWVNVDSLFKRIIELSLCLWMEIKLVWMRDLGTAKAQGLPLSLPTRHSFFLCVFFSNSNRELTSCVRQEKDASSMHCQNVIWAFKLAFPYQAHVWRLCWLAKHTAISFLYCFLCFTILCLCLFLHHHLLLFFFSPHFDLCISIYVSVSLANRHFLLLSF